MPEFDPETQAENDPSSPSSAIEEAHHDAPESIPQPGEGLHVSSSLESMHFAGGGVKRLLRVVVLASCALTALGALLLCLWSGAAARGFLLGAGAGILPFWLFGRQVERATVQAERVVEPLAFRWPVLRIGLSIAALLEGYHLSPGSPAGLLSALGGLFVIRVVLITLALTGLDLKIGKR